LPEITGRYIRSDIALSKISAISVQIRKPPIAALLALAACLAAGTVRAADVLVFAAASTTDAIAAAIAAYESPKGVRVRASFASSSTLARQIANGTPADIYLSANEKWMDWLAARDGIVPGSRLDLLRNGLVLIAPTNSKAALKIEKNFGIAAALGDGRLALGDPDHVPAGIYARQALTALGVWQAVQARTARAASVRAALALVERGAVPFGIVYATDARASARVRVIDSFPRGSHAPIVYPVALVRGRDGTAAKSFFAFLTSGPARAAFARFGFIVD
jgi:molybdate transport system substrate-binding protein